MKKRVFTGHIGDWIFVIVAILLLATALLFAAAAKVYPTSSVGYDDASDFIKKFGTEMQYVPLHGSSAEVKAAMEEHYAPYVSTELLAAWEANPLNAPGQLRTTPTPKALQVKSVQKVGVSGYVVRAFVLEQTATGTSTSPVLLDFGITHYVTSWKITEFGTSTDKK